MDFSNFDRRNHPTVPARTGYGEWASDGIDLTPESLERARYDLRFVVVGMHPFFFMTGERV
jgi:hypothetical protein